MVIDALMHVGCKPRPVHITGLSHYLCIWGFVLFTPIMFGMMDQVALPV